MEKQAALKSLKEMKRITQLSLTMFRNQISFDRLILESIWNNFLLNAYTVAEFWNIKHEVNINNPFNIWSNIFDTQKHTNMVKNKTKNYVKNCKDPKKSYLAFISGNNREPNDEVSMKIRQGLYNIFVVPYIHIPALLASNLDINKAEINFVLFWWRVLDEFVSFLMEKYDEICDNMSFKDKSELWRIFDKYKEDKKIKHPRALAISYLMSRTFHIFISINTISYG